MHRIILPIPGTVASLPALVLAGRAVASLSPTKTPQSQPGLAELNDS